MQTWQQWQMFFSWKSENIQWKMIISNRKWEKNVTKRINKTIWISKKKVLNLIKCRHGSIGSSGQCSSPEKASRRPTTSSFEDKIWGFSNNMCFIYFWLLFLCFSENAPWFCYLNADLNQGRASKKKQKNIQIFHIWMSFIFVTI